jgi:hypothetical protein
MELGMSKDEASEFLTELMSLVGMDDIPDSYFLFYCIKYLAKENKELKEEIHWMKQEYEF